MRLNKNIVHRWVDQFGRDREGIVEIKAKGFRLNLKETETKDLLKLLCISINCKYSCDECCLKNEESFRKYIGELRDG